MRTSLPVALAALALVACDGAGTDPTAGSPAVVAREGSAPVTVMNGAEAPVPVAGAVAATQSGPWEVTVANPLAVTVGGPLSVGGSVTVANPVASPVPVRDVTPTPWMHRLTFTQDDASAAAVSASRDFYTVPAGKRLVIEQVNLWGSLPGDQLAGYGAVDVQLGDQRGTFHVPMARQAFTGNLDAGTQVVMGSQLMKINAGPGATVHAGFGRRPSFGRVLVDISMSGYLVDLP